MNIPAIRTPASSGIAEAAIIFIHGLGDTGAGWSWFPRYLAQTNVVPNHDKINYVFPHAPTIPITGNGGMKMPGWYDIIDFENFTGKRDVEGFLKGCDQIKDLIKEQHEINHIPYDKIILAGFSQGASLSLALNTLLDYKICGVIALSGFCPIPQELPELYNKSSPNFKTPIFQGHGTADPIVPYKFAMDSIQLYKDLGFDQFTVKSYPGMPHLCSEEELNDVAQFIKSVL